MGKMKKINLMTFLLIIVMTLSACSGALANEPQSRQNAPLVQPTNTPEDEGMVVPEESILEPGTENEFIFTEEDVQDDSPENEEPAGSLPEGEGEDPGKVFPEDKVEPSTESPTAVLPPLGDSSWEVTHKDGTITCRTGTQTFGEGEIETVRIETNPINLDGFILWNFENKPEGILFVRYEKDNPITQFKGQMDIPGTDGELHFVIYFENPSGGTVATNMYGTISSEMQGCAVTRDFTGVLVD